EMQRALARLTTVVAEMRGDYLEIRYEKHAAGLFQRILRRIRVVPSAELEQMATAAEDAGTLTEEEHANLMRADLVLHGQERPGREARYLVVEVSAVIDSHDVTRAYDRAQLLSRLAGVPVISAVAGEGLTGEAARLLDRLHVRAVFDGRENP